MNTNQQTERQNCQITPFSYEDRAVRTVLIDDAPWFIAKDVCEVLGIAEARSSLRDFPENEKGVHNTHTLGGKQEMLIVNEPGLYRLIFQSRKPEAEKFKTWVFTDVLPAIRGTGYCGMREIESNACVCEIYRLFSNCPDMTLQRINKIIYYFSATPPLSSMDIAKLLGVNDSTVRLWRKRLTTEMALNAVAALGINAQGSATSQTVIPICERPGFPLNLPAREVRDEQA